MMQNIIIAEFEKTFFKSIKRYAKACNTTEDKIRIIFSLKNDFEVVYHVYVSTDGQLKKHKEVTFDELVDIRGLDLLNKRGKIPPIICGIMVHYCNEKKIETPQVRIVLLRQGDDIRFCLYNGTTYLQDISSDDITEIIMSLLERQ